MKPPRPLTQLERECADNLAFRLADIMCEQVPVLFGDPPESLIAVTLPVACELVRAKASALRNERHARKYRKLTRQARELLRAEPDSAVPPGGLGATVAFDPEAWHTALVPGLGREGLAVASGPS